MTGLGVVGGWSSLELRKTVAAGEWVESVWGGEVDWTSRFLVADFSRRRRRGVIIVRGFRFKLGLRNATWAGSPILNGVCCVLGLHFVVYFILFFGLITDFIWVSTGINKSFSKASCHPKID